MNKAILIERETLQHSVMELMTDGGRLKEFFEKVPVLVLLLPIFAYELTNKLFGKEETEKENEE